MKSWFKICKKKSKNPTATVDPTFPVFGDIYRGNGRRIT